MEPQLGNLKIDRSEKRSAEPSPWATRFIIAGIAFFVLVGAAALAWNKLSSPAMEVETARVHAMTSGAGASDPVILNATGYIIAAHTIDVAAKVDGKVLWIGVDKGDHVKLGQVLVRLEDDEYRARVLEAQGALDNLKAHLSELENGSRPEEISKAKADVEQAKADQDDALVTLKRTQQLVREGVFPRQQLDDAQAKYDDAAARVNSLQRTYDLSKLGPRREEIEAARAQVKQAQGTLDYARTQLDDTIITAPVTGTILDRNVEKGEFVTTGFVGDKGAKGYVVSLADLNDLQVELDINQNDFSKLGSKTRGIVTTDAYPDRRYDGEIEQISPEANRQKATVQVKVQVLHPDSYLRPEMNATVAFLGDVKAGESAPTQTMVVIPATAVRDNAVFVITDDRAVKRPVKLGGTNAQGVIVEGGLIGGEDIVVNPPADLKDGQKVKVKA
ncbi:MAG: efflux RND transporter periplasmic adaptor subunit [Bryobacteraceae bacterium]|jgi:HlyD family secretion protein